MSDERRLAEARPVPRQLSFTSPPLALVVLVEGKRAVSAYVDAETCLNHVEDLATMLPKSIAISLYHARDEWKWKAKGTHE